MSESREQIVGLGKEVGRILTTIRSAMNESRPIHRLPPEVFARLFEFRVHERDLVAATQVCSRWRTTLISTPVLWTNINFEDTSRASLYLERSKAALINVTVGKTRSFIVGPEGAFLGAIPWVARMKSLYIQAEEEQIKTIAQRLCHKTPQLRSLTLKGQARQYHSALTNHNNSGGGAIYIPPDFLGRHAPLLRSLNFSAISPSVVFSFPLPNLTYIDWVAESAYVVIEELLDLFASSSLIEVIKMHVKVRRTRAYESLREVTLNRLHRLDWVDTDGMISLIPCLTAPRLTDLAVRVTRSAQPVTTTLSAILPPHGGHFPLLVEPSGLEYSYQSGTRSCRFRYDGPAYFMIREQARSRVTDPTVSRWLSPATPISFTQADFLSIEASGGCPPLADIPIRQFDKLEMLMLVGETDSLVPMIQPDRGAPGAPPSVPCPKLSEIRISPKDHYFQLDQLARVLKERKEAGYGVQTVKIYGESRCLPGQIKELEKLVDELVIQ